ncbi:hypothetical protein PROVRETT_10014 [Providencia rettgeri DSM 1131]|nr:hypothetical protein PROVRETT_10014 [Providencia rettgeri DSM 1131]
MIYRLNLFFVVSKVERINKEDKVKCDIYHINVNICSNSLTIY